VTFNDVAHTGFEFDTLRTFLAANPHNFLASVGIVLVLSGIAFKVAAFPFQIWVPDVDARSFRTAAHRQSLAVANSSGEAADQAFIDSIADWSE
jgi:NADH:ubiquinone oxidoreductase subunit 2 (subunit N)